MPENITGPFRAPEGVLNITPKGAPASTGAVPGFTLIEILVTVIVIALGCLAALWLQSVAMRGHAQSDHLTAATSLAESEVERLRSLPWPDLTAEVGDHGAAGRTQIDLNRQGLVKPEGRGPWPYIRVIRYYANQPTSLSHQVVVEVRWRDMHGSHEVASTAAITSPGLNAN